MAISGNYPAPVTVNGFSCRNCSDVDRARKNIDPANPSSGPFGINDTKSEKTGHGSRHLFDHNAVDALDTAARGRAGGFDSSRATAYDRADDGVGKRVDLTA